MTPIGSVINSGSPPGWREEEMKRVQQKKASSAEMTFTSKDVEPVYGFEVKAGESSSDQEEPGATLESK